MKIDRLLFTAYGAAGLAISIFTATMTYLIIGEPIGRYMFSEIFLTVLLTLPVIWGFSHLIGRHLSVKVASVRAELETIMQTQAPASGAVRENVFEFAEIHRAVAELAGRLEQSLGELERQNGNLERMMRSLAHDINTPLTIMLGYLEEIEDGLCPPQKLPGTVAVLKKEVFYLQELSGDVVEYLRSLQEERPRERVALKPLLEEEIFPLLKPFEAVELSHSVGEGETLLFNRVDLKKLLFNLLHNSVRFTQKGSIGVVFDGENLSVSDSGSGIAPERRERLFEPMGTADLSKSRRNGGFGLGLGIARNLARHNGYRLALDETFSPGTRFVLSPEP